MINASRGTDRRRCGSPSGRRTCTVLPAASKPSTGGALTSTSNDCVRGSPAGNTVQVRLPLGEPQRRLSVPRDALIIRADGLYVVKVDSDKRAERVLVKAGVADGDWIAVDGSLRAGDSIVVRGGESLRGNDKLDVIGVLEGEATRVTVEHTKPAA